MRVSVVCRVLVNAGVLTLLAVSPLLAEAFDRSRSLTAQDAANLFQQVCVGNQPDFTGSAKAMKGLGFTAPGDNGAVANASLDAFFVVQPGPQKLQNSVRSCALVFTSPSGDMSLVQELRQIPETRVRSANDPGSLKYKGNGQKIISVAHYGSSRNSHWFIYEFFVGANAEQYDQ